MCGIAGFISSSGGLSSGLLEKMGAGIIHRGPDDEGYLTFANGSAELHRTPPPPDLMTPMGMAFRRLSIIDLSPNGAQPMGTPDGRYWMVFNGQIYNYVELRKELEVEWKSKSDTEVLLHAFAKWGTDVHRKIKGMYAFAIWDAQERVTTIFRDPVGVKPLYYRKDDTGFYFSSEVRGLLPTLPQKPTLNRSLLGRYLLCNWIPDPDTLFEGIYKLEPGHYLQIDENANVTNLRYWNFRYSPMESPGMEEWIAKLDQAINGSLTRQMRSDVPLGFFLSGGLDSSLLTGKATRLSEQRPGTFTTGFKWSRSKADDLDISCSRLMRDQFPIDYQEILLEPDVVNILPKVIRCLEEPIADPAAICSYLICEAAAKKFKVLVSGQGADELFGGYPVYQAGWVTHAIQRFPTPMINAALFAGRGLPYSIANFPIQTVHRGKKVLAAALESWPRSFAMLRSPLSRTLYDKILNSDLAAEQKDPFARHVELHETAKNWDLYQQMMYLDFKTYLPSLNLAYGDKTSMGHSVEIRVPYLDQEMVSLTERIPSRFRIQLNDSKMVLKELAQDFLPHRIIHRKKSGFGLPIRDWFLKDLQPMAQDLLSESRLRQQGLLEPTLPEKWLKEHAKKKHDHCMKLYNLMTLQVWMEEFGVSA